MNRLKCNSLIIVFLAIINPVILAQNVRFPDLKGYKNVNEYPVYTPDDLWNYINGAADAYLALGFIDLHISEYVKGKQLIKAEIYRFGSEIESFGMYSMERSPDYHFIKVGVQGYNEEGVLNFYKGEYYIKIMTHSKSGKLNESMRLLAGRMAEGIQGKNEFPAFIRSFPQEGLLGNQETFILEGVLGQDYLRGAFRASYEVEGDRFEIYLFDTNSAAVTSAMAEKLTGLPSEEGSAETEKFVVEDGFNGLLYIARKGLKLVIVSGLGSDKNILAEHYIELTIGKF